MTTILDHIDTLTDAAEALSRFEAQDNISAALSEVDKANIALGEIATRLVERGARAGMTQKRMADLLGIPASALRGARAEFASTR